MKCRSWVSGDKEKHNIAISANIGGRRKTLHNTTTKAPFKNIINGYLANNDTRKLDSELIFVRKKIDESVREIQQLENNLSFFSNTSDDNPMVKNVHKNIDNFKRGLMVWKDKLAYLRSLDY